MTQRTIEPYRDETLPERFLRWIETIRARFKTIPNYTEFTGSPEGVIFGQKADRYYDLTADEVYIKTTQGGNTGWVLITTGGGDATFQGLGQWRYRTTTGGTPAAGQLEFDNADINLATEFYLNVTNDNGVDMTAFLSLISENDLVYIQVSNDSAKYVVTQVGIPSLAASVFTFPIVLAEGVGGGVTNNTPVSVVTAAPGGGGGGSPGGADTNVQYNNAGAFGGDANFVWDSVNATLILDNSPGTFQPSINIINIDPSGIAILMGGLGSGSTNWAVYRTVEQGGDEYWELIDDHSGSVSNHRLFWRSDTGAKFLEFDRSGEMRIMGTESIEMMFLDVNADVVAIRNGATLYLEETAVNPDIATHGQIWAATDQSLNFTDRLGVNTVIAPAAGAIAPGTVTNSTLRWNGSAWVEVTGVLHIEAGATTVEVRGSGAFLQLHTTGASVDEKETRIKMDNFAGFAIQSVTDGGSNGPFLMGANRTGSAWQDLEIQTNVAIFGNLYLSNIPGVQVDRGNMGQIYVDVGDDLVHYQDEFGVNQVLDPSLSELNVQDGNYTLVLADKGKTIAKRAGGAGETYTIPSNASVPYKIGTWVAFDNDGGGDLTIAITTDVLVGTDGVTGSRTLGDNQRAMAQKIDTTRWRYQATDL